MSKRHRNHLRDVQARQAVPEPIEAAPIIQDGHTFPSSWIKGQLLNVRNAGSHYNVTLLGEEYDTRYPDRCLQFPNAFEAQQFVSWWYQRESRDPRAA